MFDRQPFEVSLGAGSIPAEAKCLIPGSTEEIAGRQMVAGGCIAEQAHKDDLDGVPRRVVVVEDSPRHGEHAPGMCVEQRFQARGVSARCVGSGLWEWFAGRTPTGCVIHTVLPSGALIGG